PGTTLSPYTTLFRSLAVRPGRRGGRVAVRARPARQRRPCAWRRGRWPAPADPRELRPAGAHPDAGYRGGKPQRLGCRRRDPVRSGAPAPFLTEAPASRPGGEDPAAVLPRP